MTDKELLTMLEYNLELILDYMDEEARKAKEDELTFYIKAAKEYIAREGITLVNTTGDAALIVMYASWLYDRRKAPEGNQAMPRMLRYNLNNRLFSEKVKA